MDPTDLTQRIEELEAELRQLHSPSVHDPAWLDTTAELIGETGADILRWGLPVEDATRRGLRAVALQCLISLAYFDPSRQEGLLTILEAFDLEATELRQEAQDGLLDDSRTTDHHN